MRLGRKQESYTKELREACTGRVIARVSYMSKLAFEKFLVLR